MNERLLKKLTVLAWQSTCDEPERSQAERKLVDFVEQRHFDRNSLHNSLQPCVLRTSCQSGSTSPANRHHLQPERQFLHIPPGNSNCRRTSSLASLPSTLPSRRVHIQNVRKNVRPMRILDRKSFDGYAAMPSIKHHIALTASSPDSFQARGVTPMPSRSVVFAPYS